VTAEIKSTRRGLCSPLSNLAPERAAKAGKIERFVEVEIRSWLFSPDFPFDNSRKYR
jgi:hypothetical protein